jgi:hypothetical protein
MRYDKIVLIKYCFLNKANISSGDKKISRIYQNYIEYYYALVQRHKKAC